MARFERWDCMTGFEKVLFVIGVIFLIMVALWVLSWFKMIMVPIKYSCCIMKDACYKLYNIRRTKAYRAASSVINNKVIFIKNGLAVDEENGNNTKSINKKEESRKIRNKKQKK